MRAQGPQGRLAVWKWETRPCGLQSLEGGPSLDGHGGCALGLERRAAGLCLAHSDCSMEGGGLSSLRDRLGAEGQEVGAGAVWWQDPKQPPLLSLASWAFSGCSRGPGAGVALGLASWPRALVPEACSLGRLLSLLGTPLSHLLWGYSGIFMTITCVTRTFI